MKHSNSTLDALERLNVILGGSDDDAVNITDAIDQIGDALENGGGVAVIIDDTLTHPNQAADAKAAGDAIAAAGTVDATLTQTGVAADSKATGDAIAIAGAVDATLTQTGVAADSKATGDAIAIAGAVDQNLTQTGVAADAAATGYAINNARTTIDSTLSNSGQAADAKAVGDAIRNISTDVDTTLAITGMAADSKTVGDRLLALQNAIGAPKKAATISDMTDVDAIYVYTGSEAGYTAGHWYYYDNNLWQDGGVYNATAVNTDTSLSVSGQAADAEAVGQMRTDLEYVPVEITALSVNPAYAEKGSTLNSATVTYTLNKMPTSLKLGSETLANASSGSKALTSLGLTDDTTLTLEAKDGGSHSHAATTVTKTVDIEFVNRIIYGVKVTAATIDSAFVMSLSEKILSGDKSRTINVNSTSNKYIWYCYPARLGTCVFKIGGIEGGFEAASTVSVTNASGFAEDFYVYRSTNHTLGNTIVEIS